MNYPSLNLGVVTGPSFSQQIEQEFTRASAIAPSLFDAATRLVDDLEVLPGNDPRYPIHEALNWRVTRFGKQARPNSQGLLLLNEDGSIWQAKLSNPGTDKTTGKTRKYETPVGNGAKAYLPPIPVVIRQKISERYEVSLPSDGSFWDFIEEHPEIPIVVTEGGKKGLSGLTQGFVTIALYGCNGGVSKFVTIAGEKIRKLKPALIPDLARFAQPGRQWLLAFDQDTALKTRLKVERALGDLAFYLEKTGGNVRIASWDAQNGWCKGVDDLIANAGVSAWETAVAQAQPSEEWRCLCRLARAVRRKPDLNIGDREFKEVADAYPQTGIVAFWGAKATGKTQAMSAMIGDRTYLSFTALQSVARDQAVTFPSGVFVNDADRYGHRLLGADGSKAQGGVVCLPSLFKVAAVPGQVLVLDELTALAEFLLGSKLANKHGMRRLLIEEWERRIRGADLVLIGDADLTEAILHWIESIRDERAFLVRSERQPLTYVAKIIDGTLLQAIAELQQRVEAMPDGKLLYINTDAKRQAQQLADLLGRERSLLITSDTSGGKTESSFLTSKGSDIPQLLQQGIRFVISSPSVVQGFSLTQHTDRFDSVWGFYQGCSITPNGMAHGLDRVRSATVPRFLHVPKRGRAYSSLSQAQTTAIWLKEFKAASTVTARLVRDSLIPRAEQQVDSIDWNGDRHLQMLASLEVNRNQGMVALRFSLIALLKHEGKQVQTLVPTVSKAQTAAAKTALKTSGNQLEEAHYRAVAAAEDITPEQAAAWSKGTTALTPEQLLALEKFYLAEFYRLETVTAADVSFDKNGKTRQQLRRLEWTINPALATETTANSINKGGSCPQDWSTAALQTQLLERVGAAALIRQISQGERASYQADEPDIQAIAEQVRKLAKEFHIAFGFRNLDKLSDLQIIGTVLDWVGLRRKRHRTRVGGQVLSHYQINQDHLSALLTIVKRRQKADPPPLEQNINEGGGSATNADDWLSESNLAGIKTMWADAGDDEAVRRVVRQVIPGYVLQYLGLSEALKPGDRA